MRLSLSAGAHNDDFITARGILTSPSVAFASQSAGTHVKKRRLSDTQSTKWLLVRSMNGFEVFVHHQLTNLSAHGLSYRGGVAVVNAAVHACR